MEKAMSPRTADYPARYGTEKFHRPTPSLPAALTCSPASRAIVKRRLLPTAGSASEGFLWRPALGQHTRIGQRQRLVLRDEQLLASPLCGIEQFVQRRSREGGALAGALHLDERPGVGGYDVHVDLGAGVFLVGQVDADPTVDDAYADRGDRTGQRPRIRQLAGRREASDRISQRDVRP